MENEPIKYELVASGYKDYVKINYGIMQVVYIKTNADTFPFIREQMQHMVDAINLVPTLTDALKSIRGIEAWITPKERKLTAKIYTALDEYSNTSLGKYNSN